MTSSGSTAEDPEYLKLWHAVFEDRPYEERPFRALAWDVVLLTEDLYMDSQRWGWLQQALEDRGEYALVVSNVKGVNARTIQWNDMGLDKSLVPVRLALLAHDDVYLFGLSGEWGLICTLADFSILGGVETFVGRFLELAGGPDRLRGEFLERIHSPGWLVSSHTTERLLKIAGWK